ncbi:MAG: MucB/RseB C-terminal domain-containing protein [Gammaproteobacteria bacterium]
MRMTSALDSRNYDGVFVYQRGSQTDSMRIIHRHDGRGSRERLYSLSGSAREVIRDGETVTCIFPDDRAVMVEQGRTKRLFPSAFVAPAGDLASNYELTVAGEDRVAGRSAWLVTIRPRTPDRYGYRLWIDVESDLLLKSNVLDPGGFVLEQFMFTQLDLPAAIADDLLKPATSGEGFERIARQSGQEAPPVPAGQWEARWLPAGFSLRDHADQPVAGNAGPVRHLVYSDGLAMVSIFVEPVVDGKPTLRGFSSMGAVNAFSTVADAWQVTVVGEVPRATVQRIATEVVLRGK